MYITDLTHLRDEKGIAPRPARRLAEFLGRGVPAATVAATSASKKHCRCRPSMTEFPTASRARVRGLRHARAAVENSCRAAQGTKQRDARFWGHCAQTPKITRIQIAVNSISLWREKLKQLRRFPSDENALR